MTQCIHSYFSSTRFLFQTLKGTEMFFSSSRKKFENLFAYFKPLLFLHFFFFASFFRKFLFIYFLLHFLSYCKLFFISICFSFISILTLSPFFFKFFWHAFYLDKKKNNKICYSKKNSWSRKFSRCCNCISILGQWLSATIFNKPFPEQISHEERDYNKKRFKMHRSCCEK